MYTCNDRTEPTRSTRAGKPCVCVCVCVCVCACVRVCVWVQGWAGRFPFTADLAVVVVRIVLELLATVWALVDRRHAPELEQAQSARICLQRRHHEVVCESMMTAADHRRHVPIVRKIGFAQRCRQQAQVYALGSDYAAADGGGSSLGTRGTRGTRMVSTQFGRFSGSFVRTCTLLDARDGEAPLRLAAWAEHACPCAVQPVAPGCTMLLQQVVRCVATCSSPQNTRICARSGRAPSANELSAVLP